jgi:ACS family glucarate transporter-like MFS transporter
MIPGGRLVDRVGPRLVLLGVGLGSALFTGLTALAGNPELNVLLGVVPAFCVMRFGMGLFTAPLYPACARINANWFDPTQRARVWGLVSAGAGIGSAATPLLTTWIIRHWGWRESFWIAGGITALLTVIGITVLRNHPHRTPPVSETLPEAQRPKRGAEPTHWRQLLSNRSLALLTLAYTGVGYFEYIFFFWTYHYFEKIRGMSSEKSAVYTTLLHIAWLTMTPLGGWAADRLIVRFGKLRGGRVVPITGLTLSAGLLCLGVNLSGELSVAIVLALALGMAAATDGSFWSTAIDLGRTQTGAATGILNTGANIGGLIAPTLTPWIASYTDWSCALYFASVVVLLSVICWFFITPSEEERVADPLL